MNHKGFTIVEFLVVVVVIAILTVITVVSFNGMQNRAKATTIISEANSILKMAELYRAQYGEYPKGPLDTTNAWEVCANLENKCTKGDGSQLPTSNTTFLNMMSEFGNMPTTSQGQVDPNGRQGIYYKYEPRDPIINPGPWSMLVVYWLPGNGTNCGMPVYDSNVTTPAPSTTGYTPTNGTSTGCWVRR